MERMPSRRATGIPSYNCRRRAGRGAGLVQIALTQRPLPTAGFQVLRLKAQRLLVTNPFRLGEPVNLRYGIATISGDEQALRLHESLIARLWEGALTGARALDEIARMMKP